MKLIIAGGRHYKFTEEDKFFLDEILSKNNIEEVVSGGATGADSCGDDWARENGITVKRFSANWYRKDGTIDYSAGPRRNKQMAQYADAVVLFPGWKGTKNMRDFAEALGLVIYERKKEVL